MDLYKEICSKYPDTSFRLEDMQATVQYEAVHGKNSCPYLGYNNSMNQVGTNFGEKSQKSIEIDVSVLKNAVNDPEYKERLLNKIDGTLDSYSRWVSDANEQGATNMCVGITDEGEGIQTYGVFSQVAFSTEEQIKAMWSENSAVEALMQKAQQMQDSLIEGYMQALTEHTIAEDAYTEVFDQIDSGTGAESIQA
jgi:hypothetical protein